MSENTTLSLRANEIKFSVEQLRSFPGMEKYSDAELKEIAESLKEFSLMLYAAFSKSTTDNK